MQRSFLRLEMLHSLLHLTALILICLIGFSMFGNNEAKKVAGDLDGGSWGEIYKDTLIMNYEFDEDGTFTFGCYSTSDVLGNYRLKSDSGTFEIDTENKQIRLTPAEKSGLVAPYLNYSISKNGDLSLYDPICEGLLHRTDLSVN